MDLLGNLVAKGRRPVGDVCSTERFRLIDSRDKMRGSLSLRWGCQRMGFALGGADGASAPAPTGLGCGVFQTDPQAESRYGCLRWCGVVKNGCPRPGPNALRPSLSARPRPGHPPRRGGRPGSSPATAGPPLSAAEARRSRSGRRTSPPSLPPASGRAGRGHESDQVALEAR